MRDFNFFSVLIIDEQNARKRAVLTVAGLLVLILIIGGIYVFTELVANNIENDIEKMEDYLSSPQVIEKRNILANKKTKLEILSAYNTAVSDIKAEIEEQDIVGSTIIEKINSTFPQRIFINSIIMTAKSISISGISEGRVPLAEFYNNLMELDIFENIHMMEVKETEEGSKNNDFVLSCILKRGAIIDENE